MKFLKLSILSVFVFSFLFITPLIFAEDAKGTTSVTTSTETPKAKEAVLVATVNIENIKIVSKEGNNLKISFDLTNQQGIQSGLRYGVKLIGKSSKGSQYTADEKIYTEDVTLYENSSIHKEISYTAPNSLLGQYSLWISANNTNGFPFAFAYAGEVGFNSSIKGINILSDTCFVSIKDETNNKKYTLDQGVDINPSEILILNCDVLNSSNSEISATPSYETTYRNAYGDIVSAEGGSLDKVVFKPLEKKAVSLELPKATKPQAYDVKVSLKVGDNVSNSIKVHYVIRGNSATIQKISINKDSYKKGETAILSFFWSGQADIFPDNRSGIKVNASNFINVEVLGSNGKQCANPIVNQGLDSSIPEQKSFILITSDCKNPKVSLTLKDGSGNVLDQKSVSIDTQPANSKGVAPIYYIIIIIILIAIGVVLYMKFKKGKNKDGEDKLKPLPFHVLFPFLILVAFGSILPNVASANTYVAGDSNGRNASFAINGIKTSYTPGESVTFSGTVTVTNCLNQPKDVAGSITFNGVTQDLFTNITVDGAGKFNLTPVTINAPSDAGNYSMALSLKFGDSTTTYAYYSVTATTSTGKCYISQNYPYYCEAGSAFYENEGQTSWTWQCGGWPLTMSDTCTLSKTPVDGICSAYYINSCQMNTVFKDLPDDATNSLWDCEGIYGGGTTHCSMPLPAKCGTEIGTCDFGVLNSSIWVNGGYSSVGYTAEWLCSTNTGGINCKKTIDDFYADISGYCEIPVDESDCSIDASWKFINSPDKNFQLCSPDGCIPMNADYNQEGNRHLPGTMTYGDPSETISIRSSSGEVYKEAKAPVQCTYPSHWDNLKDKCVTDGGWTSFSQPSDCSATCNGNTGTVQGETTRTRTCTAPAPSQYGPSCFGSNTETTACSVECLAGKPTSPVITGPSTFGTGSLQEFNFQSYDPENDLIRYGIDWNFIDPNTWSYYKYADYNNYYSYNPDKSYKGTETIGEWFPNPDPTLSFKPSGYVAPLSHKWDLPGTYAFRAIAQDYNYPANVSKDWTWKTVTVTNAAWVNLSSDKVTVKKGDAIKLKWESGFTNSCTADFSVNPQNACSYPMTSLDGGCANTTYGTSATNLTIDKTTTFTVTCKPNAYSLSQTNVTSSVTIEVPEDDNKPITVALTPKTQTVSKGNEAILNWSVTSGNATGGCKIPGNVEKKASTGFFKDTPMVNKDYTVTCYKSSYEQDPTILNGSGSATATVTVTPPSHTCLNGDTNYPTCNDGEGCKNKKQDIGFEDGIDCGGRCLTIDPTKKCSAPSPKPKPIIKEI